MKTRIPGALVSFLGLSALVAGTAIGCGGDDASATATSPAADAGGAGTATGDAATSGVDAAGQPDAGGIVPGPVDAIVAAMEPGSWKELPGTRMADVCPPPYEHYRCEAVVSAWSGGAYDSLRDRLVVWGGGHGDSPYNNVFTFDLASMTWKRWTELPATMTGDTVPAIFQDKRVETCGLYPKGPSLSIPEDWLTPTGYVQPEKCDDPSIVAQLDPQQPRSAHTYGNVAFSPATGRFYGLGAAGLYPSGQAGTRRVSSFDFATGRWGRGADTPRADYGASATDGAGHIWYVGGAKLQEYDPVADRWTSHAADGAGYYYAGAAVDTKRNVLTLTAAGTTLSTYALSDAAKTHATVTTSGLGATLKQAPGLEYLANRDRFVAWSGGKTAFVLDPASATWSAVEGTGDDPGAAATNGTFGRFRYSAARDVLVVVSSTERNVFLWKPPAVAR